MDIALKLFYRSLSPISDRITSLCMGLNRKIQTVVKASSRVDKYSKSDIIVSPSILSANFSKLGEQVPFYHLFFKEL